MRLTLPQASRLFNLEPTLCERVLGTLVDRRVPLAEWDDVRAVRREVTTKPQMVSDAIAVSDSRWADRDQQPLARRSRRLARADWSVRHPTGLWLAAD